MKTRVNEKPLIREFMEKASLVSARVYPVKDLASAFSLTLELCRAKAPREELMSPLQEMETRAERDSTASRRFWIMGVPNLDERSFSQLAKACAKAGSFTCPSFSPPPLPKARTEQIIFRTKRLRDSADKALGAFAALCESR